MSGIIVDNTGKSSGLVKASSTGAGVSWQSSIQTSNFTAENGKGYFIDTSSSAITVTLPSSPSAGNLISFKDYAGTFGTNNLTIARNDEKIQGITANSTISTNKASITCLYVDSTEGWVFTQEYNVDTLGAAEYVAATGGSITTSGNFKIHTFTSSGTFNVTSQGNPLGSSEVSYMVVAGGGGGMMGGGGGGAGGFREGKTPQDSYTSSPLDAGSGIQVSEQAYPITVGAGGAAPNAGPSATPSDKGSNSVFSTITSAGGGGGGNGSVPAPYPNPFGPPNSTGVHFGEPGGSGSGAIKFFNVLDTASGGSGNTPPVSPSQGNDGGDCPGPGGGSGGGGGGASSAGADVPNSNVAAGGNGGNGIATQITASPVTRAGGGGGGGRSDSPGNPNQSGGSAGPGGGGAGGQSKPAGAGGSGSANTGGGGGGGGKKDGETGNGGAGGSGIVVIRYKFQN